MPDRRPTATRRQKHDATDDYPGTTRQNKGIAGKVETGRVDNARNMRRPTKSLYKVGKARSGGWSTSHPIGGKLLSFAQRGRNSR